MKKKEYTKDDIPAATQLFTPHWIVQYMVENSLGRLYITMRRHQGLHADGKGVEEQSIDEINQKRINTEKAISESMHWKYYLPEAKQDSEIDNYEEFKLESLKIIDPCVGSGHILVYAFDVLMDIYRDQGYSDRDATRSILENNLYGLEIDERAYHLAYFALMMKSREYNRRILSNKTKVNVFEIREPVSDYKPEYDQYLGDNKVVAENLVDEFKEAKELGSIINPSCTLEQLDQLESKINDLTTNLNNLDLVSQTEIKEIDELLMPLIKQARLLVQKYDVTITNPPYMAPSSKQKKYVKKNYPNSKADLFAVFIEKCHSLTKTNEYQAMITMHSWMFLSSYEKLRKKLLHENTIVNMAHLGARAFEDIGGEVVQTTTFIFEKNYIKNYQSSFKRLVDYNSQDGKEREYLSNKNLYISSSENFSKIPGSPIAYWVSEKILLLYCNQKKIKNYGELKHGMTTGNNDRCLRYWYEIDTCKFIHSAKNLDEFINSNCVYVPYNKGGAYKKWYGNLDYILGYNKKYNDYMDTLGGHRHDNQKFYFKKAITWSLTNSSYFGARMRPTGSIFDVNGMSMFVTDEKKYNYILGLLCSKISTKFMLINNPTLASQVGDVSKIPVCYEENKKTRIDLYVDKCVKYTQSDWDSYEISWDFKVHPLVKNHDHTIQEEYLLWKDECNNRFKELKSNEEELNRIFIDIYGLQDELTPEESDKDITVHYVVDDKDSIPESFTGSKYVRTKKDEIKSFISYAVGCMFGRYSLDCEGLAYAGGDWDLSKYKSFIPDADDIIPICDEEYFEDDIVSRFVEFVRVVYGPEHLESNLQFISDALGGKGSPREVLRNYFLNQFYKDHCNTYQVTGSGKRPIYWLFDSGKKSGFKVLVYIHRYTPDLIARMRTGYIHPLQSQYRTQIEMLNHQIDEAGSTSERVKLQKQLKKITEQSQELGKYEEKIHHWADKMEPMDLDDGVKANYAKFQELLAKIK